MTESMSFKAYLKRDGQEVEVRRFGIDGGAATNYMYLRSKIQAMFPSIQNDQFSIFWQDSDKDYITVSSDEELVEALTAATVAPVKLYIHVQAHLAQGGSPQSEHQGVVCDGCEGAVTGFRYKCVTCPDFDLCVTCESAGRHPEHFMLRMPTPMGAACHPKFFRKFFGRPHKFHKRHGWSRFGDMPHGEEYQPQGAGRCPFSRRGNPGPTAAGAGATGVPDLFDFSGLMEFINSLGVTVPGDVLNQTPVTPQSASSSQPPPPQTSSSQPPPPQTSSSQPQPPQTSSSQENCRPNQREYLKTIGETITAFLDPFGVDVTFDVRTKSDGQETAAPGTSSQQNPLTPETPAPPTSPRSEPASTPNYQNLPTTETPAPAFIPTPAQTEAARESPPNSARRNSDDWTLLNRESPTRSEAVAMDVDESRKAGPQTLYPELPKESPSAPPQPQPQPDNSISKRIQEDIERIHAMGFNFDSTALRELLSKENNNIATVLEMILSNPNKK